MVRTARLFACIALIAPLALTASPAKAGLPECDGTFQAVETPAPARDSALYGVDGVAADNVWSVGVAIGREFRSLVLHWDGSSWARTPVGPVAQDSVLGAVDVIASDDAWAVGQSFDSFPIHGIAFHWDGTTWRQVDETHGNTFQYLNGVAAVAPDDVWATGVRIAFGFPPPPGHGRSARLADAFRSAAARGHGPTPEAISEAVAGRSGFAVERSVIRHFDGTRWRTVDHPSLRKPWTNLNAVAGATPDDVWAVGTNHIVPIGGDDLWGGRRVLIEHFDGSVWTHTRAPNPGTRRNSLEGIDVVSPDDVWAVGWQRDDHARTPLVLHYDGARWSAVPAPSLGRSSELLSVSAAGPHDVWATGVWRGEKGAFHKLIEHYDGFAWSEVRAPYPGRDLSFALASAAVGDDIWWVGLTIPDRFGSARAISARRC